MNDGVDCRTAQATPGLLIRHNKNIAPYFACENASYLRSQILIYEAVQMFTLILRPLWVCFLVFQNSEKMDKIL